MDLLGNSWISLGVQDKDFSSVIKLLVEVYAKTRDVVAFDRTFAEDELIDRLKLSSTKDEIYSPMLSAREDRFISVLSPEFLNIIVTTTQESWASKGLENFSLYRNETCYLETLTHHSMIIARTSREKLMELGIECDIFSLNERDFKRE